MQKNNSKSIHVIDSSVREQMHVFDRYEDNYFSDTISLITNFEPYAKKVRIGRPTRTPEHRIILVRQGTTTINVSYNDYSLKEGHLLIIPANSVLIKKTQSDEYNVFCVAFRIPEIEHLGLIDYKERHIVLSDSERRVVENYFRLMEQIIKSRSINRQGVHYLIISLLYGIHTLYQELDRPVGPVRPDRPLEIMNGFTRLLMVQEFPVRKPEYYANELNITKAIWQMLSRRSRARQRWNGLTSAPPFWHRQCSHRPTKCSKALPKNYDLAMPHSLSNSSRNRQARPPTNTANRCRPKGSSLRS